MDTLRREVLSQRVRQVKPSGIRKFFDIINTMPEVISLGVGEPDFVTPVHIRQAGVRSIELGHTKYTSNYGILELREELAAMLQRRYSLTYDPKQEILVTVGVSEGVDLAMRTIIDPGDEVISLDPGYVAYEADIIFAGGVPVAVPTFARYDFGVRAAAVHILEAMLKVHQYAIMCAGTAPQEAALEALRHGEDDVQMMHQDYTRRRRMFVDGLNRIGLTCCEPRGAFYAFPYIGNTGLTDEEFAEKLLFEEKVAVVPGSSFGAAGKGYVRCAYCTAFEQLEEALIRMERFLKKYS